MSKIEHITFVSCTTNKSTEQTLLESSLEDQYMLDFDITMFHDNAQSISVRYNEFIENCIDYYEDDTAIVFIHVDEKSEL